MAVATTSTRIMMSVAKGGTRNGTKKKVKNDSKKNKIDHQNEIVVNGVEILPMKMIAVLMKMTVNTTNAVVDKRH